MILPDLAMPLPSAIRAVHFIGIGGSGMSGIAGLFLASGHPVSGSDRTENHSTKQLRDQGASIFIGHDARHVGDVDAVVYTGALWPDNPEYLEAVRRGVVMLHRSQALAWLIGAHRLVAVAGAHGKTTSTGMIVTALSAMGADPSFVNGGVIQSFDTSARPGSGELFVIEADESDGTFLLYDTAVALITNVDADHLDHYGSHDAFDRAFVTFAERASELLVISSDDLGAQRVTRSLSGQRVITFGEHADSSVRLHSVDATGPVSLALSWEGRDYVMQLAVPGRHNAKNAAGAFAVLVGLGFPPDEVVSGLEGFAGTERRFELHGNRRGVRVFDDYAHHPTEVMAALSTARSVVGSGRVIAIHQPHLYSRTQAMAGQFAEAYERLADHTIVLDVFGAREDPIPGVTGALVADRFIDQNAVDYLPDWQDAADRVSAIARHGDLVMTLSCGDVYRIIPQVLEALGTAEAQTAGIEPTGAEPAGA